MISSPERITNDLMHGINDHEEVQVNLFLDQARLWKAPAQREVSASGEAPKKAKGGEDPALRLCRGMCACDQEMASSLVQTRLPRSSISQMS